MAGTASSPQHKRKFLVSPPDHAGSKQTRERAGNSDERKWHGGQFIRRGQLIAHQSGNCQVNRDRTGKKQITDRKDNGDAAWYVSHDALLEG